MLTDKDIQKLKKELATKKDLKDIRKDFQSADTKLLFEVFYHQKKLRRI